MYEFKKREKLYAIRRGEDGLPFIQVLFPNGLHTKTGHHCPTGLKLKNKIKGEGMGQFDCLKGRKHLAWQSISDDYSRGWIFDELGDAITRIRRYAEKLEGMAQETLSEVASLKCRADKIKSERRIYETTGPDIRLRRNPVRRRPQVTHAKRQGCELGEI